MIPTILLGRLRAPGADPLTPLTGGAIAQGAHDATTIRATLTPPTGGSGSQTRQWTVGVSPISGAVGLTLAWTGRTTETSYEVGCVVTDTVTLETVTLGPVTMTTSAAGTIIASWDFNDGTLGPYVAESNHPGSVDVVDDPTGSGRGKVARIWYDLSARLDEPIASTDRSIVLPGQSWGFSTTRFFRGDLYLPAPSNHNRKILRLDMKNNPSSNHLVVGIWGTTLRVEGNSKGPPMEWLDKHLGEYAGDTWHTLEVQVTTNSAVGVRDGALRIWMNGDLRYDKSPGSPLGGSLWLDAGDAIVRVRFGQQLSISAGETREEYRYWDNVSVSTTRLGA